MTEGVKVLILLKPTSLVTSKENKVVFYFATHRHIEHIERVIFLKNQAKFKVKYSFLCVLCAYVFQNNIK